MDNKPQLIEKYIDYFLKGQAFASIVQARQFVADLVDPKEASALKLIEEAIEAAVVRAASVIVEKNEPLNAFDQLVDLYQRQPNLATRTSTSIRQQAYSTPIPIAYLAGVLAGIDSSKACYEPTAGHGALVLGSNPDTVWANEINPKRAAELRQRGFKVTSNDASIYLPDQKFDVVIANPPFGSVQIAGREQSWNVRGGPNTRPYRTSQVDHAIALNSLQALKDQGRAVLILGAPLSNKMGNTKAASQTYNSLVNRAFYKSLYDNYLVTDHFCIAGNLYSRQGTTYPVDVIVIAGRGKSNLDLPAAAVPRVLTTFDQLREMLDEHLSKTTSRLVPADREFDSSQPNGDFAGGEGGNSQPTDLPGIFEPAASLDDPGRAGGGRTGESLPVGLPGSSFTSDPDTDGLGQGDTAELDTTGDSGNINPRTRPDNTAANLPTSARASPGGDDRTISGADPRRVAELDAGNLPGITMTEQTQVPYQPRSLGNPVGTLTPINMAAAVERALKDLEAQRGQIDVYVSEQLGFSTSDLYKRFSAEQIDALGLAIHNVSRGESFIIGDQTGIGKGRFVAGIIEFAKQNNLVPIFVTQDPKLYADIYRDLADIGVENLNPLVTNSSLNIPLPNGNRLRSPGLASHTQQLDSIIRTGDLGSYNAVFTTYSQMQSVKGKDTIRRDLLRSIASRSILILDESHNAGGTKKEWSELGALDRADFVRELVTKSAGVVYSSATYAKNPYVMTLYSARTGMRHAVNKQSNLVDMIEAGGIPLQQVLAAQLVEAGQYLRRERSFEGVEFGVDLVEVNQQLAEDMATCMRGIMEFDELKRPAVTDLSDALKKEAKSIEKDNSVGRAGVDSTNFTALMHNVISQSLLALRTEATVQRAIQALDAGEKPVIVLSNTMGSFIQETAEDMQLKQGDEIPLSIGDLLNRYLDRSRDVLIKDYEGHTTRRRLTDEELGAAATKVFEKTRSVIRSLDWSGVPVSPIDWMHYRLRESGYSSSEITGRTHKIEYGGGLQTYQQRPKDEIGAAGAMQAVNRFNGGELDVIILNRSGATGISLHASEKFPDQRPRRMIIAQSEPNIDAFMQSLGRVHRTGQVELPRYSFMVGDIPAEKRPAAVLMKKMASLNANTTAARRGDFQLDCVDFMNHYGDRVAYDLLVSNLSLNMRLGYPISGSRSGLDLDFGHSNSDDKETYEGIMAKLTGRIPVLPIKEQERVYNILERAYLDKIKEEESIGTNTLEATKLNLEAKIQGRLEIMKAKEEISSPFAGPVYVDIVDAKAERLPFTKHQLESKIYEILRIDPTSTVGYDPGVVYSAALQHAKCLYDDCWQRTQEYGNGLQQNQTPEGKQYNSKFILAKQNLLGYIQDTLNNYPIGESVVLTDKDGYISYGVVKNVWNNNSEGENPLRLSQWRLEIALASSQQSVTVSFSKINTLEGIRIDFANSIPQMNMPLFDFFDYQQRNARETRQIFTGNPLRAYEKYSGKFINYTLENGQVKQGMIMRHGFDIQRVMAQEPVKMPDAARCLAFIERMNRSCDLKTEDESLVIKPCYPSGLKLYTSKRKDEGGKYFLDEELLEAAGDEFVSKDGMVLEVRAERELAVLEYLYENGSPLFAFNNLEQARDFLGITLPQLTDIENQATFVLESLPPYVELPTSINESAELVVSLERMFSSESAETIPEQEKLEIKPEAKTIPPELPNQHVKETKVTGYKPTLQEMRDWVQDARILGKGEKYLERVKALAADMLEGTDQADISVAKRDPNYRNPNYILSDKALDAMEQARAESAWFRCPTREMLMLWYKASEVQGADPSKLALIKSLGKRQIEGTAEEAKPTQERNRHFKNPNLTLSYTEHKEMVASIEWFKERLVQENAKNSGKVKQETR